jgi:ABC-2 type transport system permease protein
MNKMGLILRYEMGTAVRRKSFLLTVFGLPVLAVLAVVVASLLRDSGSGPATETGLGGDPTELAVEGYVDHAGLLVEIPDYLPQNVLRPFPGEARAAQALREGEITAYYLIPADYVDRGDLLYVDPDYRPFSAASQSWVMQQALFANLVGSDPARLARAQQPMEVVDRPLDPELVDAPESGPMTFLVPYALTMIIYMLVMLAASLLMSSVTDEKKNRTLEILLSSLRPQDLLAGKIIGLGLLGLLQTVVWIGTGYTLLRLSGRMFELPFPIVLPPSILVWGVVFSLLGYAIYASLMAGIGALVANARQASQVLILVIWPLIVPLFFYPALIEKSQGAVAMALSLFPLTAPVAMMTRLAVGGVPVWQPLLAVVLVAATAVLAVRAVARLFRAQTLLSGAEFSAGRFFRALAGRSP